MCIIACLGRSLLVKSLMQLHCHHELAEPYASQCLARPPSRVSSKTEVPLAPQVKHLSSFVICSESRVLLSWRHDHCTLLTWQPKVPWIGILPAGSWSSFVRTARQATVHLTSSLTSTDWWYLVVFGEPCICMDHMCSLHWWPLMNDPSGQTQMVCMSTVLPWQKKISSSAAGVRFLGCSLSEPPRRPVEAFEMSAELQKCILTQK